MNRVVLKPSQHIWIATTILALLGYASYLFQPLLYPDIFWQLREGLSFLSGGYGGISMPESFGAHAADLIHEYVGYEALLALVYQGAGWWGVWALQVMIPLGIPLFVIIFYFVEGKGKEPYWLAAFGLILLWAVLRVRFQSRPEVLGYVWQMAGCALLLYSGRMPLFRLGLGLGICSFLWSNTHSSFILLFAMCGFWSLEGIFRSGAVYSLDFKKMLPLLLVSLAAFFGAMFHPAGWQRIILPLVHQGNEWAIVITDEMWRSPWILMVNLIVIHLLVLLLLMAKLRERTPFWLFIMASLGLWMTAQHIRYIGVWIIFVSCLLMMLLWSAEEEENQRRNPVWGPWLACLASIFCLLLGLKSYSNYFQWPIQANMVGGDGIQWVAQSGTPKSVLLTDMCAGSYVAELGDSKMRVLLDTGLARFDESTLRSYYYINNQPEALEMALEKLHLDFVLIYGRNARWAAVINKHPDWQLVQYRQGQFVYARRSDDRFEAIHPPEFQQSAWPFFYRLHQVPALKSLEMWCRYPDTLMDETHFPFLWVWLEGLPVETLRELRAQLPQDAPHDVVALIAYAEAGAPRDPQAWREKPWIASFLALQSETKTQAWSLIQNYQPIAHHSAQQEKVRAAMGLEQTEFQKKLVWNEENKAWLAEEILRMNERIASWKQGE
ncbi:MAG: hypothetical protein HC904_03815 [Blastochloris sp.]|nr:hypothetical protein [Blastochloris sp.]